MKETITPEDFNSNLMTIYSTRNVEDIEAIVKDVINKGSDHQLARLNGALLAKYSKIPLQTVTEGSTLASRD